jgi:hypothetical protein
MKMEMFAIPDEAKTDTENKSLKLGGGQASDLWDVVYI